MLVTPIYEIVDKAKFKNELEKMVSIVKTVSSKYVYIKPKQCFTVKNKYLIPVIVRTGDYTETFAFLIYWLIKKKVIRLHSFYTSDGRLITNGKNSEEFKLYSELLKIVQNCKASHKMDIYDIKTGDRIGEVNCKMIALGFELKTLINAGDKKVMGIKVYFVTVPDYDLNEWFKNKYYIDTGSATNGDVIITLKNSKIKCLYPKVKNDTLIFTSLFFNKFSIRDILLLFSLQKYIPYQKSEDRNYIKSVIKRVNILNIVKALLLDAPDRILFDGKKLRINYREGITDIGHINIDLKKIDRIFESRMPIKLSKYLDFESREYGEISLKVPERELRELFRPCNGSVDYSLYAMHDDLLIPLIMINSGQVFVSTPLLIGLTLYGILKDWTPYKFAREDLLNNCIVVNYNNTLKVTFIPIECLYRYEGLVCRQGKAVRVRIEKVSNDISKEIKREETICVSDEVFGTLFKSC